MRAPLTPKLGLFRTEITTKNGEEILHVWVKDYPDSVEFPLVPRLASCLFVDLCSEQLLRSLSYIPSEVDIWDALVEPYDMGDSFSKFFSTYLGTPCKLAYVNTNRPRYIQGTLPPERAQNGKHPVTGLSDGAAYQFVNLVGFLMRPVSVLRIPWRISILGWKSRCLSFVFGRT